MPYIFVSIPYFVVWILWPEFLIYLQEYGFLINSKISIIGSGDKQLSVTNFVDFKI